VEEPLVERSEVEDAETGEKYKGQWRGEKYHGHGMLCRPGGSWYEGDFAAGKADGKGRLVAINGNVYEGHWVQDRAEGFGKYIHEDGSTYAGQWCQDSKNGNGIERWSDGSKYEGCFLNGKKYGRGKFTNSNGTPVYEGNFANDTMHGEGTFYFPVGRKYKGQYHYGHIQGVGAMTFADGSSYIGDFVNDLRHGNGTFQWPDGRKYVGPWNHGKMDGEGTVIELSGAERTSMWRLGVEERATTFEEADARAAASSHDGQCASARSKDDKKTHDDEVDNWGDDVDDAIGTFFEVTIAKTKQNSKLGMALGGKKEDKFLTLSAVDAGGLIDVWNQKHGPELQVNVGDRILEVNDIRNDQGKLLYEMAKATNLKLQVTRTASR
jgi:hypothetical protein